MTRGRSRRRADAPSPARPPRRTRAGRDAPAPRFAAGPRSAVGARRAAECLLLGATTVEARRAASCLLVGAAVVAAAGGADAQPAELVTDRPDQTESAAVVPRGLFQVETGYLFTRDSGVDGHAGPGTLFRIGLGGRTELRLAHAGIVGGGGVRGAGDSEIGAKVNLVSRADGRRPQFALLGALSLPTGAPGFSSGGADASFLAAFAHGLGPRLSLGWNAGAAWESASDRPGRRAFIVYSLALGVSLTDRLGTFLEVFGDRQVKGASSVAASVDTGLTLLLTDVLQLDLSAGRGLRGPADDLFVGAGLSLRLPR